MTDLHCHILPNIDDGAKDVSISLRLLEKEYADGSLFDSKRICKEG